MIRVLSCIVMVVACICSSYAQPELNGLIVDKESGDVMPYAQVQISSRAFGTLSNLEGVFELQLLASDLNDTLEFSYLGYTKLKIPVQDYLYSNISKVAMSKEVYALKELVIKPKTAREYVQIAIQNTPKFYTSYDVNSTLFAREVVRINGQYLRLNEAILKGFFTSFSAETPSQDTSRIKILAYREYENTALLESGTGDLEEKKMLYESLLNFFVDFSAYRLFDSTFTRNWYEKPSRYDDLNFEHGEILRDGEKNIMNILVYDKRNEERSNATGTIQLDYDKLAVRGAHLLMKPSGVRFGMLKTLLRLSGIKLEDFFAYVDYDYHLVQNKYLPFGVSTSINVVMEKVHWFKPNDLIHIEIDVFMTTLDNEVPATDRCLKGKILLKNKHISKQVDGVYEPKTFDAYPSVVKKESFFE